MSDMYGCLLCAIICYCILTIGLSAEQCSQTVLGRRETKQVPEGGSLSLFCDVQHCGVTWTGNWMWTHFTDKKLIKNSDQHSLTNLTLSANKTRLLLNFLKINQSDEGSYRCVVTWSQGNSDQGHLTYVNVTAAVSTKRNLLHRFIVCGCACLCLPIILGLARCLSSGRKPQTLPRTHIIRFTHSSENRGPTHFAPKPPPRRPVPKKRSTSSHKARPWSEQRSEVVYADISQDALRQQGAIREPVHSTVYSSVRFS